MFRKSSKFLFLVIFILNGFLFYPFTTKYDITSEESTPEVDSSHYDDCNHSRFGTSTLGIEQTNHSTSHSNNNQDPKTNIHFQMENSAKIRINEIRYEIESSRPADEKARDEYIELLVVEGDFDPSYWYITDWDNNNYWEIPISCPVVSTGELIVIHLGSGSNDNVGPVFHFYMNKLAQQLDNQGEPLTLFTDSDATHNRSEDLAHDFVVYGTISESEPITVNAWCDWPNNGNVVTDSIDLAVTYYETLQLVGNDFDNSSNWYSSKPTQGESNKLNHYHIEDFDNEVYLNTTATNATGWGNGRILPGIGEANNPIFRDTVGWYASDIYVSENYAYVADGSGGLAIIDVSDPNNPGEPIYRDTAGEAWGIYIIDDYAFVAAGDRGLAIVNISDPTNPGEPIIRELTGVAEDVYVSGNYAYIAEGYWGLAIIDVHDPLNPGMPIYRDTIGSAYGVYISDNYAYVASGSGGLAIIDISNPTSPGMPIYKEIIGDAYDVYVSGNYAYIAEEGRGLAIINISDPTNPGTPIYQTIGEVSSVFVKDNFAYVAEPEIGLLIIDISDPTDPGTPIIRVITGSITGIYVSGDYVYASGGKWAEEVNETWVWVEYGLVIVEVAQLASRSIVQSTSFYTSKDFVQNVTIYANQTDYPKTSINHQISSNGNTWIPINLNETYSFAVNPYHDLFWCAVLETDDPQAPSPHIDSIRIDFDVYYDEDPPTIQLITPQNNTAISPETVIELLVTDVEYSLNEYTLDQCWFAWDEGDNIPLTAPWTIVAPTSEEYHWLTVQVNDTGSNLALKRYRFYLNHHPLIVLQFPHNNSLIIPMTDIDCHITDLTLTNAWYQWDGQENTSFTAPFIVQAPNSTRTHILLISARDSWNKTTMEVFIFYIINSASVKITHPSPSTAYSKESFVYTFTISNLDLVPLNLTVGVFGTDYEVLTGNGSQLILHSGDNWTVELEIRPKHASVHQLDICLFHDDFLFYREKLLINVAPQWMSPTFLLPLLIIIILLFFAITVLGTSIYYVRRQYLTRRIYWEQRPQLIQLIDQLTISNLEATIATGSDDSSSGPLGFPQHLQLSEPLNREVIELEYYSLRERILNGDPNNLQKLTKLLNQAEELLKDKKEV